MDLKKLTTDLKDANAAAMQASTSGEDGGSCNLDSLYVTLPVRYSQKIAAAFEQAGMRLDKRPFKGTSRFVGINHSGQGCLRTQGVEAASKLLQSRGWDCFHVWYQMD